MEKQKIQQNPQMLQKSFYTWGRWKSWHINKWWMWIGAMERDLANKGWDLEITWLKHYSGDSSPLHRKSSSRGKHKLCVAWWGNLDISWLLLAFCCHIFSHLLSFLFEFVYLHLLGLRITKGPMIWYHDTCVPIRCYHDIAICWVLQHHILWFFSPFSNANHFPKVKLCRHHLFHLIK